MDADQPPEVHEAFEAYRAVLDEFYEHRAVPTELRDRRPHQLCEPYREKEEEGGGGGAGPALFDNPLSVPTPPAAAPDQVPPPKLPPAAQPYVAPPPQEPKKQQPPPQQPPPTPGS